MASVILYTNEKIDELIADGVVNAVITDGHLILQKQDGSTVDVGEIIIDIPAASETVEGIVELATDTETITGTSTALAVTPFGLAARVASETARGMIELATTAEITTGTDAIRAVTPAGLVSRVASDTATGLVELATNAETITGTSTTLAVTPAGAKAAYQPLDTDLTAIAGLTGTNDNFIQRKSGAWSERTPAQAAVDLVSAGFIITAKVHNSTAYVDFTGVRIFVGPTDPGSVPAGTVWFDTTGT